MKKLLLASVLIFVAASSFALEAKPYVALKAGYFEMDYKMDESKVQDGSMIAPIAIGASLSKNFRFEAEYFYGSGFKGTNNNIETEIDTHALFMNFFLTHVDSDDIELYLGLGLGAARLKGEVDGNGSDWNTNFAYALYGGFAIPIVKNLKADIGLRYINFDAGSIRNYKAWGFAPSIGLRYSF